LYSLELTALPGPSGPGSLIEPGDDLGAIIAVGLRASGIRLRDGDIIVVAHKVVSKAEGRLVYLPDVEPSARAQRLARKVDKDARLVEVILRESRSVRRAVPGVLIVTTKLGFVCANAGVDHSNVKGSDDWVALLPADPDASARTIRRRLGELAGAEVAVIVSDSHGRAWREGTVGVAIGCAGLEPLSDLRGKLDLYGRELRVTTVGLADELASAASLLMGQADEGRPVVHVRGLEYVASELSARVLQRPRERDLFR
jgi:coenzyme F420-0:L-glutamate ligase/coenzyme F420-1:gamma-L-glutamate ligase